jgi:phage FluMu gp28-like protein
MVTAVFDPLVWLQQYTCTKDSHWKEAGAGTPYRPFPDKPYFRFVLHEIHRNKVLLIEKSRDMMLSWLCVGYFTHAAITTERREVLFQSQKEDKAAELIDYARILYEQQPQALKQRSPLAKPLRSQSSLKLEFANGSRLVGIPEGADQIRSYHPWGLLMDEAAFQPEAGEAYDAAVPVCEKIVVVSSAGPGWFADFVTDSL